MVNAEPQHDDQISSVGMSALPPKADMRQGAQNVRLVPKADMGLDLT